MKVKCTRSICGRFKVGKIYSVNSDGGITDEYGFDGTPCRTDTFEHWYSDSCWCDNDFELVEESKMFTKEDIQSGDKIITVFGKGIVVGFNGEKLIRYDDHNGFDRVNTIYLSNIKKVIRPKNECDIRVLDLGCGEVIFDSEKGIGCKPPIKEIALSEATKLLTEKFGENVKIVVNE